jgi:rhodanese-related sulfurtransferase
MRQAYWRTKAVQRTGGSILIAGVGTAGSSYGTFQALKEANKHCQLIGLTARRHDYIPGIRSAEELWENGIFHSSEYHKLVAVTSKDAIEGMLTLIRRCGVPAGPSSGANLFGALEYLRTIDGSLTEEKVAVFFACDRMEPYLSYVKERRPDIFGLGQSTAIWRELSLEEVLDAPSLSITKCEEWINKEAPLIVDVRSTVSYSLSHIPGALNFPLDQLSELFSYGCPFPKSRPLLFVCQQGVFTCPISAYLSLKGFKVFNLAEGMRGWITASLPLENSVVGVLRNETKPAPPNLERMVAI